MPAALACRALRAAAFIALTTFTAALAMLPAHAAPPPAPSVPARDVMHGVTVDDPYRNLEDLKNPQTRAWLDAQGQFAAEQLGRIAGRDAMAQRIQALSRSAGDVVYAVNRLPGGRVYYLKRRAGASQFVLMMRQGLRGKERVLVDPQALAKATGVPHAINYFVPSWDGRTLAYGISAGGSEDASLHLMDIASGKPLGKPIPRVPGGDIHWTPDSRQLSFNQLRELPPGTPDSETYMDTSVLLLDRDRPDAAPRPLFGPLVDPRLGLDRLDVGEVMFSPGSRWMIARTTDTTVPEGRIFVAPLSALLMRIAGPIRWTPIATATDKITDVQLHGDLLLLQTYAGAPRGRVLALDLRKPVLAEAREWIAEPAQGVLKMMELGRDAVYAELRAGFNTRVLRFPLPSADGAGAGPGVDVAPGLAGSTFVLRDPAHTHGDVLVGTSTWTAPSRIYRVGAGGRAVDTGLRDNPMPPGAPAIEVTETLVPSHDGARVPLAVLHRKGLVLDGRNPTLLVGYGSYGHTMEARFDARQLAWLERGGVVALANPRGSGAFGDPWYRAGFKATKRNTWLDGIACAQWLVDKGYASPATLGIWGTSAGGIFVGRAVTTAPALFAAAIFDVGVLDAVRAEETANGVTNISEFGTVKEPAEFKALLEMSTYHQIQPGTPYPAVLLIHGMNDPRVDVWHSAKTAARLQAASTSGKPVLLRLDGQAGHGMGSTAQQGVDKLADVYSFLLWQFGKTTAAP
jgi:prolyl oligopeptidase